MLYCLLVVTAAWSSRAFSSGSLKSRRPSESDLSNAHAALACLQPIRDHCQRCSAPHLNWPSARGRPVVTECGSLCAAGALNKYVYRRVRPCTTYRYTAAVVDIRQDLEIRLGKAILSEWRESMAFCSFWPGLVTRVCPARCGSTLTMIKSVVAAAAAAMPARRSLGCGSWTSRRPRVRTLAHAVFRRMWQDIEHDIFQPGRTG